MQKDHVSSVVAIAFATIKLDRRLATSVCPSGVSSICISSYLDVLSLPLDIDFSGGMMDHLLRVKEASRESFRRP